MAAVGGAILLGTVFLLVAAVLLQLIQLAGGMLVHEISVLLVILNALRLVRLDGPSSRAEADLPAGEAADAPVGRIEEKEPAL